MKKLFTLLWLFVAAFTFKSAAQGTTTCNADFTYQYLTNYSVKFTPAMADSPAVQHSWNFGDGSAVVHQVVPTHSFALPGTYAVVHTVVRNNPNGVPVCTQSLTKQVVIEQSCNLVVDFSSAPLPTNSLSIHFTNLSVPLAATDSITWNFGDNTSSHEVNPTHTYANAGTYNVCLIVKKWPNTSATPCIKYICKPVVVIVTTPCNLVVDFSWAATTASPLSIQFTNLSMPLSPTDSITWTFGDGTSSNSVSPLHAYTSPGTYTVCLKVKKNSNAGSAPCVRDICKTIIVSEPCNLVVNFSWTIAATNPLMVQFTNLSTPSSPTDSTTWNFGDGSTSFAANPLHTYAHAGTYNVCLIVKKNSTVPGTTPCIRYICKTVVIQEPCTLVVNFSMAAAPTNPLMIQFTNLSVPLAATDSTIWNFGDGVTSYAVNPLHTYANAGTYTVCLIVKKNSNIPGTTPCIRYLCRAIEVQAPCNLHADFTWRIDSVNAQKIWFTNTTTPLSTSDSVRWTFGDGTSSNVFNPDHTYAQPGTYTVCLRVQKRGPSGTVYNCISEICKTIVVYPTCNLVANFTWVADQTNAQKIWFTNTSAPISTADSIRWTFGDGTASNVMNPDHTYAQPGTYTVCLRIQKRNTAGGVYNCVREICKTIVVQPSCNFQANFSWRFDSLNFKKVYFTNLTTVPTATATALWIFGDGTSATSWNAVHEYAQPGKYYVCLRVQLSPNCVRYKCDSITIAVPPPPCNNQSNFNALASSTNSQTFTFIPDYQSAAAQYTWTFGDGTGSHDMIATHHYAQPGTYTACLTVWRSATCASTTCKTINVIRQINCDSIHVTYNYQRDPFMPNKLYFYAIANATILDQTWTITRLNGPNTTPPVVLHQNNPVYVFHDTGYYRVCLRAVTLGGCIKEYCSVIHIETVPPLCQLQAYPNPATSTISVNVNLTAPTTINVYVYNALNVLVKEKHQPGVTGNNIVTLGITDLVAGYYTMKVIYGNNNCNSAFQKL